MAERGPMDISIFVKDPGTANFVRALPSGLQKVKSLLFAVEPVLSLFFAQVESVLSQSFPPLHWKIS